MRSYSKAERGSSLPETVIVMGVLMALICGIIDFGRATYTYSFVAQLARQGARWAIVRGTGCSVLNDCSATASEVQSYVQSLSEGATEPSSISVSYTAVTTGCSLPPAPGCTIAVTVSYPFKFFLPFVLPGTTLEVSSTSEMVVSN